MIRTLAIAASVLAVSQSSAFAASIDIEFDRARLDDPAYVEMFYAELEDAARSVCKKELAGAPLYFAHMKGCVEATLTESIEKIGSPLLTAYANDEPMPVQVAASE